MPQLHVGATLSGASAVTDARIGELLRLQVLLDGPDISLDDLRAYLVERLEAIYPLDYHVYRRRWERLAAGDASGDANWPRLNYLEWRCMVDALAEEVRLGEMLGEGESRKAREWRSLLMVGPEWEMRECHDSSAPDPDQSHPVA
jgi:hypothetical protein